MALAEVMSRSDSRLAGAVSAWYFEASAADWSCAADVVSRHSAALVDGDRVLFDLGEDGHCVVVRINYELRSVLIGYLGRCEAAPWKRRARKTAGRS